MHAESNLQLVAIFKASKKIFEQIIEFQMNMY